MKILIADDDAFILDYISRILKSEKFELITATNGKEALTLFENNHPDLVLLDVMMPQMDGLEVCAKIREQNALIPIILLTAKQQTSDKVEGLQTGADDYITKPFERQEFLARIERNLKRSRLLQQVSSSTVQGQPTFSETGPKQLEVDALTVDLESWKVFYNEKPLKTSKTEFELLKLFCENKDQLLDRETLLKEVWGYEYIGNSRTIDNFIMRLRKKMQKLQGDKENVLPLLETVYGMGYRLRSSESPE